MDARELKGLEIAARMRVVRDGASWSVPSQTGPGTYRVDPVAPCCTCDDFQLRQLPCKHVFAARLVAEREKGNEQPQAPVPDAKPVTCRPTYKQNWPAYVRAQSTEKNRFRVLLRELCRGIEEPSKVKTGRPRVPLADRVFTCCFKVWSGLSGRRFNCDLEDAHTAGYLSRPIHPHKISAFMEDPDMAPILRQLIAESSRPLATVESAFAADSSSFTTARYVRWFDQKYGRARSEHVWLKVQLMCGVKTNVVTSAVVCEQDGPDSPYLPELVNDTAERFTMKEVSADKGYSSTYGHDAVDAVGATPFIAFKRTATGGSGGVWQRMYHFHQYRRDEFLAAYHKRSNVESVFSAVKRKFGDALRSKTRPAQVAELYCKLLAHNLVVLIHEQEELGITAEFWQDERGESRSILPFPSTATH